MPLGKQYAGMWTLSQQLQAVSGRTWTGIPAVQSLYAWGRAHVGQLGDNRAVPGRSSPVQVGSGDTWTTIALDSQFSGGIKSNGGLYLWGSNTYGELGLGNATDLNSRSSPTQVGSDTNWAMISVGYKSTYAIKTNGTLWAWGQDGNGALGLNTGNINKSSPVQVGSLTTWSKVCALVSSAAAIKTDGTLWSWGYNIYGQVGNSSTANVSSPVQIGADTNWSALAGHNSCPIAQKTNGSIYIWGQNAGGRLGLNDTILRSSPVQIGAATDWILAEHGNGNSSTSLLRKTNGTLWGFGYNNYGMIGHNFTGHPSVFCNNNVTKPKL